MYFDIPSTRQNDVQLEANKGEINLIIENAFYQGKESFDDNYRKKFI